MTGTRWCAVAAAAALAACGGGGGGGGGDGGGGGGTTSTLTVRGTVFASTGTGRGTTTPAVAVSATIAGAAIASATSDADGAYTLTATVPASTPAVVLRFEKDGHAPFYRRLTVAASTDLALNVTLRQLEPLACSAGDCALDDRKLRIEGLPTGTDGDARVFNPVTETSAFPGAFKDSDGKLLVSGVFASMSLTGPGGAPLRALAVDAPAQLTLALPRDTWPVVKDIDPVTDTQIEVPLYSFDEASGEWVRDGQGVLVDDAGALIPASALAAIHDGSFPGGVNATGAVQHFSYWNVDWPVDTHACVTGTVKTASGAVAQGATVTAAGETYTGTSTPQVTGADGRFCVEVMRSEGGAQTIRLSVAHQGQVYVFTGQATPAAQGTCGGSTCTDLGDLVLADARRMSVAECTITGTFVDRQGAPIEGALIWAFDDSVPQEVVEARCATDFELCLSMATSAADGSFTLRALALEGVTVGGYATTTTATSTLWRYGERGYTGCPPAGLTLAADQGYEWLNLTVTATGSEIAWTPAASAAWLWAYGATEYKWMIEATGTAGFSAPVTYGTVPTGATQVWPENAASPAALAAGDVVSVMVSGTNADGYPVWGTASCTFDGAACTTAQ